MIGKYLPKHLNAWEQIVLRQQYDSAITSEQVSKITSEKLNSVYCWGLSEYFIVRASLTSAAINVIAGLTNIPQNYDPNQFMFPVLGALALSATGLTKILSDGTINESLQGIDRKIKIPNNVKPSVLSTPKHA